MPYYWRHFFLSFNLSNVHTAADRCYHHTQPRRRLRICHSVRSGFNVIHTKQICLFKLLCLPEFEIEDCLQSIWLLSCYKLIDWLIRPLWSCAYGSENCPEEWSNSGQQRQLQIAKGCCSDCTQGIHFVAPRRRFFCCPRRQWLECYDCHATWCEEQATKRCCCPQGESEYRAINQTSPTMLLRKNLHCYSSVARKKICRVKPRIPGDASWPTNTTVVSPTYQS